MANILESHVSNWEFWLAFGTAVVYCARSIFTLEVLVKAHSKELDARAQYFGVITDMSVRIARIETELIAVREHMHQREANGR